MYIKADITVPAQIRAQPAADIRTLSARKKVIGTRLQPSRPSSAGLVTATAAVLIGCACASAQQNSVDIGQSWPDRRPLGKIAFAQSEDISDTNLNGWVNGGPSNLGVAAFQEDILSRVNTAIQSTIRMHGQGIIIWDIAGCGKTTPSLPNQQYLGDPRFLDPKGAGLTVQTAY